ncbi:hypothetical protein VT84_16455 [Gemmata sp. SH-PL17]|uniref:hypothetical protein n=1 Tax=Gemmata sp. SH-PL17 TaxID=1630693 RepID=UPI00078E1682|nr:hypothetical protein [Gemmata sp. SH-PL17]AMV25992.1 hypothetical protein VT84_16455 [Gemmata sp. SH-PL17]
MGVVACPGCGLPRNESELATKPCPICETHSGAPTQNRAEEVGAPEPVAPIDLAPVPPSAPLPLRPPESLPRPKRFLPGAALFCSGALLGAGALLALQALAGPKAEPSRTEPEVTTRTEERPAPAPAPPVAPAPREPPPKMANPEPKSGSVVAQTGRVFTIDLGPNPSDTFAVPFAMKSGDHIVVRGKVKTFRAPALNGGIVLDASGLEATGITIAGKIEGGATLKLSAPNGTVQVTGRIESGAVVDIRAPGGEVNFTFVSGGAKEGAKIDSGAMVTVAARLVDFKSEITGEGTKVSVALSRNGWLKVATISGAAAVEYTTPPGSRPDIVVGAVAPTATFRKIE